MTNIRGEEDKAVSEIDRRDDRLIVFTDERATTRSRILRAAAPW